MMRNILVRMCGVGLLVFASPIMLQAQTTGATTTGATTGATTGGAAQGGGGGAGASQGAAGTSVSGAVGANLIKSYPVYSASSGAGSTTTIPSSSNYLANTMVNYYSLGMPSLYSTTYGAKNLISTTGGPKGKYTYLYVPVPSAATAAAAAAATPPGFSTYGVSRAPVYSTYLSDDLPLVQHESPKLSANVRGALDRSSILKDKSGIQVRVEGSVVLLSGAVGSEKEFRVAEGLARMTPGVVDVRNELTVLNPKN